MKPDDFFDMQFYLNRLRWETDAGLSAFKNFDRLEGYGLAKMQLEAISTVLSQIDAANDAVAKYSRIKR